MFLCISKSPKGNWAWLLPFKKFISFDLFILSGKLMVRTFESILFFLGGGGEEG